MVQIFVALLLLAAIGVWMIRRGMQNAVSRKERGGVTDPDELAAAEEEVRRLGTFTRPEDADEQLPDWGPGATPR